MKLLNELSRLLIVASTIENSASSTQDKRNALEDTFLSLDNFRIFSGAG